MTIFVVTDSRLGRISRWKSAGSKVWCTHRSPMLQACNFFQQAIDEMRTDPPIQWALREKYKPEDKVT